MAQQAVRFQSIVAVLLESVSANFLPPTTENAAAFLMKVNHNAAFPRDIVEGEIELFPTIAAQGAQVLGGKTSGVDTDGQTLPSADLSCNHRNRLAAIRRSVHTHLKHPELGRSRFACAKSISIVEYGLPAGRRVIEFIS